MSSDDRTAGRDTDDTWNAVRRAFGRNLRAERNRQKISMVGLRDITGVDFGYIGEIERGTGNPTLQVMAKLTWGCKSQSLTCAGTSHARRPCRTGLSRGGVTPRGSAGSSR
ncbi:helix-turn-helix transcriptional regulator [Amycolatopsis sp. NPDC006131]|uniref:helix-turn-helix domain-containing protein n=1 Tax=Amycolatopsis sp. NPDC006131 TaxID=3156731 RepID=UPI00339E0B63